MNTNLAILNLIGTCMKKDCIQDTIITTATQADVPFTDQMSKDYYQFKTEQKLCSCIQLLKLPCLIRLSSIFCAHRNQFAETEFAVTSATESGTVVCTSTLKSNCHSFGFCLFFCWLVGVFYQTSSDLQASCLEFLNTVFLQLCSRSKLAQYR